jgi:hypothetical protein
LGRKKYNYTSKKKPKVLWKLVIQNLKNTYVFDRIRICIFFN